jgi:phage anti-repressor protein
MTEQALVQITEREIGEREIQTVAARDLHGFLEVGKDFSNWIKDRIRQYDFQENEDFIVFANSGENPQGGRPSKEYHVTLDMAKELAMVEKNEKGRQARRYFIRCEQELKAMMTDQVSLFAKRTERLFVMNHQITEELSVLRNNLARVEQSIFVDFPIRRFKCRDGFVHVLLVEDKPMILAKDFLRVVCGTDLYTGWTQKLKTLGLVRDVDFFVYPMEKLCNQYGVSPMAVAERLAMEGAHSNPVTIVSPRKCLRVVRDEHPKFYRWYQEKVLPHLDELYSIALNAPTWEVRS